MKNIVIFYWICTGSTVAALGIGSLFELFSNAKTVETFARLGYPEYLVPFLSVARILGISVIAFVPLNKFLLLKEWAYAGIAFDLIGAMYSHVASGDPIAAWAGILIPIALTTGSYILYHWRLAFQNRLNLR